MSITDEKNPETIKRFQAALEASGLNSFNHWAETIGMSRAMFFRVARGQSVPTIGIALVIAQTAGVSVDYLWGHIAKAYAKQANAKKIARSREAAGRVPKPFIKRRRKGTASDKTEG